MQVWDCIYCRISVLNCNTIIIFLSLTPWKWGITLYGIVLKNETFLSTNNKLKILQLIGDYYIQYKNKLYKTLRYLNRNCTHFGVGKHSLPFPGICPDCKSLFSRSTSSREDALAIASLIFHNSSAEGPVIFSIISSLPATHKKSKLKTIMCKQHQHKLRNKSCGRYESNPCWTVDRNYKTHIQIPIPQNIGENQGNFIPLS